MYDLRLPTPAHLEAVLRFLASSHSIGFRVQITDLDHNYLSTITEKVLDGQVSVNYDGDTATRTLELALFDADYDLGFDTSEFTDGVWFIDRMVQVVAEFYVPEIAMWIEVPIFTGPVRGYKRKKAVVSLQCVGKEIFARGAWTRITIKKGANQVDSIKAVLQELGETKFNFQADSSTRMKKDKVVDRSAVQSPWGWCRSTAAALGFRLYYDGAGRATLATKDQSKPVFEFEDGDGGTVLTDPDSSGDYSKIANIVLAQGPAHGHGSPPKATVTVPTSSTMHPSKFKRGGKPVYLGVVILRDAITSDRSAKTAAQNELDDRQRAAYGIQFDALPLWMLEEYDPVRVAVNGLHTTALVSAFSLGLASGAVMPIGYKKLVAPTLAKIRRL